MTGALQRLPRLLALVPWLRTHPGVSIDAAADAFAITPDQLRADIELLFCCGLPGGSPGDLIDIDLEGDRLTVRDPQTLDRPLRLTTDEGLALLVAARALADVPGLTERDALIRVQAKLESALGSGQPVQPIVTVALEAPAGQAMTGLRRGVDGGRRLHLTYLGAARDEVTERDVDPMRLLLTDGHWYLEAWCHRAEAVRLFRVDRIQYVHVLDVPAAPPAFAVPRDLADGLFQPSPEHALVELRLSAGTGWVADYYPCEYAREQADGSWLVGLRTPDFGWARQLVLRLGGRASVLAPPELAAQVGEYARRALAGYAEGVRAEGAKMAPAD